MAEVFAACDGRDAMANNMPKTPADFEESLYVISQRARMNRDVAMRYAVLFARAREDDFAAFIAAEGEQTAAATKRSPWRLRFNLNVFVFLMFVLGMALSIAVMMTRN
ncbi:MAG: hypothetical protein SGJ17_13315 [Hyphomicrobiales bacterium]|nr:hypothetical protein [Hyphomicrobiales bacterium]